MSLASLLPYDHPYAGGYPGIGSQPLPTDADALDYLSRVKAADGAGVETGVAVAVDAFFRDTKAAGVFDALKACCILAGARTLAGALVPVVGDAPTNVANGFVSGDYSRTAGLTGDAATTYLDSGRANNEDPQNDRHLCVLANLPDNATKMLAGSRTSGTNVGGVEIRHSDTFYFVPSADVATTGATPSTGVLNFIGLSRSSSTGYASRRNGATTDVVNTSGTPATGNVLIFTRNTSIDFKSDATIAFYSIGTSLDLAALDTAVSNLISAIGEAL